MAVHDITMPMSAALPVWPEDAPFEYVCAASQAGGAIANTGRIRTSLHAGTHADAPKHLDASGTPIGQMDPSLFIGPAVVVDVRGVPVIGAEHLAGCPVEEAPRVLLRTDAWADRSALPLEWPALAPDLPDYLAERGAVLLGLDVPSADPGDSTELPVHRALMGHGIAIVECLALDGVPPGRYLLSALPLRITDGDGSPVRAVLVDV